MIIDVNNMKKAEIQDDKQQKKEPLRVNQGGFNYVEIKKIKN